MESIDKKRLGWYLGLAFGISWLCALVLAFNGGLVNSPQLVPGTGITLALVLLASVYMWGPAVANFATRLITKEGRQDLYLGFDLKTNWRYWLIAWFSPGLLSILGAVIFFILFPKYYDPGMSLLKTQLAAVSSSGPTMSPLQIALMQTLIAILISPLLNFAATFGEEFGWRAYLLPKLSPLGKRKALLLSGIIWGVWHWPVILMGHNYGFNYWGYPWTGLLAMVWFTVSCGVLFGWLSLNAHSVWPAVIGHGALNGIAAIGTLFVLQPFPTLLGPTPAGVIGCLPFTLVAIWILLKVKD